MKRKPTVMLALAILVSPCVAGRPTQHDSASEQKLPKGYRIGGDVKPPKVISSFQPSLDGQQIKHLSADRKLGKTGSTIIRIVVVEDGSVRSAKVLDSFDRDLDAKAIDAVRQWKFEPATRKGVPVTVELEVEVDFHLYK